jgi:hypothetical protein
MYEYKSEIVNIVKKTKGLKVTSHIFNFVETTALDELINEQSKDGWELVTYSSIVDIVGVVGKMIVTFRKQKN